jgi:glycosyltransferase involved in cell wall biosynthesis
LRIVIISPFSVYPKGTFPIRILPIAKMLKKRGHDVCIVVPPYDNLSESGKEYTLEGVRIYNIKFRDFPIIKYFITLFSINRKILHLNPEVIYFFKPKGYSGLAAMFLAFLRRFGIFKNFVLLLDTDDWEGFGGFSDYFNKLSTYPKSMLTFFDFQERWIPLHVDAITVASRELEKKAVNEGIPVSKIFYVPNGVPERSFATNGSEVAVLRQSLGLEDVSTILLYTRFFEYKVEAVVAILKQVTRELPNVKLLVIGKGEFGEEKTLKRLLEKEGLADFVVFGGWVQFENIPNYLALGDVAIYPFDDTPLNRAKCPGKLVELMSAGCAIVANKVGQIKEYIQDGESGLLVAPCDDASFALSVIKILKDDSLKNKLSVNAQNRIMNSFNWAKLTKNVELALNYARRRNR